MIGKSLQRFLCNRKGGTAVEYGLIMALVIITMIVALVATANGTITMWNDVSAKVAAAVSGT